MNLSMDLAQWSFRSLNQHKAPQWSLAVGGDVSVFLERMIFLHQSCRDYSGHNDDRHQISHAQAHNHIKTVAGFSFIFQTEDIFLHDTGWLWEQNLFQEQTQGLQSQSRKIIVVSQVAEKNSAAYSRIIPLLPDDCWIFLLGDDIKYSGGFVTQMNQALKKQGKPDLLRIKCYTADQKIYAQMLQRDLEYLYDATISQEAAERFVECYFAQQGWCAPLWTMMLSKIMRAQTGEKLILKIEDVQRFNPQGSSADFIHTVQSFYFKDIHTWILCVMSAQGSDVIPLCRILSQHLMILLEARIRVDQGMSLHESVQKITPPLYFKRFDDTKKHLSLWSAGQLNFCIKGLFCIELMEKQRLGLDTGWKNKMIELLRQNLNR